MSVLDLHPEDLLDRSLSGILTPAESERLERHLERCESCRLERQVRGDFRDEEEPLGEDFDVQRLLSEVLTPGVDRRAEPVARVPEPRRRSSWASGSRSVRPLLLVAAALLVAGASAAAGWTGIRARQSRLVEASEASVAPGLDLRPGAAKGSVRAVAAMDRVPAVEAPDEARAAVTPTVGVASVPTTIAPVAVPEAMPGVVPLPPRPYPAVRSAPRAEPSLYPETGANEVVTPAQQLHALSGADLSPSLDAAGLFARANRARRAGDHERATELYRALGERYPASVEAHEAQAVLGRVLLGDGEASGALRCFDAYLASGGSLREDVMADRAVALSRLGRDGDETEAWGALLRAYPGSVHAERARARLRELGGR